MIYYSYIIVFLVLIKLLVKNGFVYAQIPCTPANALCSSAPLVAHVVGDCEPQTINLQALPSCCHARSAPTGPVCAPEIPPKGRNCRTISLDAPACRAASECRAMLLNFNITTQKSNTKCCDTCTCYGDPHCESFTGVIDTWVLCDARTPQGSADKCPITKGQCLSERDHNGNQCKWIEAPKGTKWQIGLMGSQCIADAANGPLPRMQMYKADDFTLDLILGERAIITQVLLSTDGSYFTMTSDACYEDYEKLIKDPNAIPWRNDKGIADPNPNWMPRTWAFTKLPGGDILWSIRGLKSKIGVNIRCTRTGVQVNGELRYGPPRLNIEELIEPKLLSDRVGADGFCKTNKIDKLKSTTKNTENVMSKGCSEGVQDDIVVEKLICSKAAVALGSDACRIEWCKATRPDWQACVLDVGRFGWARTWCAANILESNSPALCSAGDCRQCVSDVSDFGWGGTIERWKDAKEDSGTDAECVNVDDLPDEEIGCQKSIQIQYEDPARPGTWKLYKVVPENAVFCNEALTFDSSSHPVLFSNKVRLEQCDLGIECIPDSCQSEAGFAATFEFTTMDKIAEDLALLVESGDLVCNPEIHGADTKGCLQLQPPDMCPCPNA